jgi:hypothetical protein
VSISSFDSARRAGDPGGDAGILVVQRGDRPPDTRDDVLVVGKVSRLAAWLDQHEQELLVRRQEIARPLVVLLGEERFPRRRPRRRRVEPVVDRRQQRVDEGWIEANRLPEAEIDEASGEFAEDLPVDGLDQPSERRPGGILLDELVVLGHPSRRSASSSVER